MTSKRESEKEPGGNKRKKPGSAVLADLNDPAPPEGPKDKNADKRKKEVLSRLNDD